MVHRTKWGVRFLLASLFTLCSQSSVAGLSLNDSPTLTAFRSVLNGPALQLENLKFVKGVKGQYGIFVGGDESGETHPVLGIPDGIYLSTGSKNTILGPNDSDKYTYNTRVEFADPDLTAITENAIFDPVIIEFDLIPEGDQVNFLLVFGSEEYPEYVCSKFNDVFGLFVSGPGITGTRNAAMIPGSDDPIAVNNVNTGMQGTAADGAACNLSNSIYFVDNGNGNGAAGTQLDGFTRPLTASLDGLQPGERYRVKLAMADAGDQAYDSAALFKWLTSTSSDLVDLELSAQTTTEKPAKGAFLDIVYTVTNTSALATRLVEVGIELPTDIVLVSDDADGDFDVLQGTWQVGNLQGGETKTLNLRISVGDAQSYKIASEILYAFNEDPDSTPYNRLSQPDEDDTAILMLYPVSNNPPMITYADSAPTAIITYPENEIAAIVDLDVQDLDGGTEGAELSWMIAGGDDAERFVLDARGVLKFAESPDYENPVDANTDNNYVVNVKVCDQQAECDVQAITVQITDIVEDADGDGVPTDVEEEIGSDPTKADTDGDGINDSTEIGSDYDNPRDTDGDGTPDVLDPDDDGDGLLTQLENYNGGSPADDDSDADSIPDYLDPDDDGDGILTKYENYNGGTAADDDTDQDGTADYLDTDDDNDGLLTKEESPDPNNDGNPSDAVDSEGDGIVDYLDRDNDSAPGDDNDGDGLSNEEEEGLGTDPENSDSDGDGIIDGEEVGDVDAPLDTNGDGVINALDPDDDGDGILTKYENYNGGTAADDDTDQDGTADYLDTDDDNDGLLTKDESPDPNNDGNPSDAVDSEGDGLVDYLDRDNDSAPGDDNDGDGLSNEEEEGLGTDPENSDSDGDGIIDGDEVGNVDDPLDTDSDGVINALDPDDDGDGILTKHENYNGGTAADDDTDQDGTADYLDTDDDNDGLLTKDESPDPNNDGNPSDAVDSEGDGIVDYLDRDNDSAPGDDNDGDGLSNEEEEGLGTDPENSDSDGDGIIDGDEVGDVDDPLDTNGDGVINALDPDDDGDGILTKYENYNGGTAADDDTDQDGTADYLDTDDDNDGLLTKEESPDPNNDGNPSDAVDSEGDGIVDYLDRDNDSAPGDDNDGDGLTNGEENDLGTNPDESDSDGDGISDSDEVGNPDTPIDSDFDGIIDALDPDDDNDGILTADENYNGGSPVDDDSDLDNKPDYLDPDDDNDTIPTRLEDYNGNGAQDEDSDGDNIPDYLDDDDDGDGILTWLENYNAALPLDDDTDGDGTPDYLDSDDDGDGLLTIKESSDPNGNGNPDDGIDSDGDGRKDYLDADDDNDGKPTLAETADPNGDGDPADATDDDFDGVVEYLDPEFTPYVRVKLRAMLQGAYDHDLGKMHNKLRTSRVLPMRQPYSDMELSFGYGSVGNIPPFGYEGDEVLTEAVVNAEGDDAVVDWLLVEVRDSGRPTSVLAATTAVVQIDGDLVVPETGDRNLIVSGVAPGDHYVAIRHRNHLGVMTDTPVNLKADEANEYDFASVDQGVYGDEARISSVQHELMWAGDLNNSASIISEGPGSDMAVMLGAVLVAPANQEANANYPLEGYFAGDVNMDGKVVYSGPLNDVNILIGNVLLHPDNTDYQSNFVVKGALP